MLTNGYKAYLRIMKMVRNITIEETLANNSANYSERAWFEAITNDDVTVVKDTLENYEDEKDRILNGPWSIEQIELPSFVTREEIDINLPVHIAVANGSLKVLEELIAQGANILRQEDSTGYNIIHVLIAVVFFAPEREAFAIHSYKWLVNNLDANKLKTLLSQEDASGLRPLEFACQNGIISIAMEIFNTPDVYIKRHITCGMTSYKWYDITEYESATTSARQHLSPLEFIVRMDKVALRNKHLPKIFSSSIFQQWLKSKFLVALPLYIFWLLMRVLLYLVYAVYALDVSLYFDEERSETPPAEICTDFSNIRMSYVTRTVLTQYLAIHCCINIVFDTIELVFFI